MQSRQTGFANLEVMIRVQVQVWRHGSDISINPERGRLAQREDAEIGAQAEGYQEVQPIGQSSWMQVRSCAGDQIRLSG